MRPATRTILGSSPATACASCSQVRTVTTLPRGAAARPLCPAPATIASGPYLEEPVESGGVQVDAHHAIYDLGRIAAEARW